MRSSRSGIRWWLVVLMMSLGVLASRPATGQATAGASIIGQVTDATGGVLPGVTVTATSPALQVPSVVTITDERGEYRLTPLPIGLYAVTYELAGFQNLRREGVRLTVNINTTVTRVLRSGPDFLRTGGGLTAAGIAVQQAIIYPRIVQIGASYEF